MNVTTVDLIGQRPRDLGIRKGVNLTTAIVSNRETGADELLLGIIDSSGIETAIPMDLDQAIAFADHLRDYAIKATFK